MSVAARPRDDISAPGSGAPSRRGWRWGAFPAAGLAACALPPLALYALFAWRFPLLTYYANPAARDLGRLTGHSPLAAALLALGGAIVFLAYALGLRLLARPGQPCLAGAIVLLQAAASTALLLAAYPVGAADVYDYALRGRMVVLHGANPFVDRPLDLGWDMLLPYIAWPKERSAYGPLWELVAAGGVAAAVRLGGTLLLHLLAFKLLAVLALAADALLIGLIARRLAPARTWFALYLFTANPLVLFEIAANGHNDAVMLAPLLLAVWLYLRRRHGLAAVALLAAALVKLAPLLLLPLALAGGWRRLHGPARGHFLAGSAASALLLAAGLYLPFYRPGFDPFSPDQRGLFTTSFPSLAQLALAPAVGDSAARLAAGLAALALAAALALWQARRLSPADDAFPRAAHDLLLLYLALACAWLQPWYAVWPVALAAASASRRRARRAALASAVLSAKYLLFSFLLSGPGWFAPRPQREVIAGLAIALPLALGLLLTARPALAWRRTSPGAGDRAGAT